jgi:hypothetical protein
MAQDAATTLTRKRIISSDSHVCEPEGTYDDIDPRFRDQRPIFVKHEALGPCFQVPGLQMPVPLSMINAAGREPEDIQNFKLQLEDLEPGAWDPKERLVAQDKDGIYAEVIYPSVGMVLCLHEDIDYKKACFDAYNRWLAAFCSRASWCLANPTSKTTTTPATTPTGRRRWISGCPSASTSLPARPTTS